jgi:hypothetical protein
MELERRRSLALGIILGLIILGAIFLFLWGIYLNRGTISITADPPFTVITTDGKQTQCESSPCKITQKIGLRDLILVKQGHESISTEITVKLWRTVDLEVEFQVNPYIESIEKLPESDEEINYEIVFDEQTQNYKLISSTDDQKRAIVYFQKKISSPLIFSSEFSALIVDQKSNLTYRIDILGAEREVVQDFDFSEIENGIWSQEGSRFAFTQTDSPYVWLLDENNEVKETSFNKEKTSYAWTYSGNLFFITNDETISNTIGYTFGEYNPQDDSYSIIESFSEIQSLPDVLIPSNNGRIIYFQIGEEAFKLILK